jgi:hypothetical protein
VIAGHEPCGRRRRTRRRGQRKAVSRWRARHEPSLLGMRRVQALPHRLVAALRQGNHGVRRHRPRRARALPESARADDGAAAGCAFVRGGRCDLVRHRHLRSARCAAWA